MVMFGWLLESRGEGATSGLAWMVGLTEVRDNDLKVFLAVREGPVERYIVGRRTVTEKM